jgi:hypothetical protein
MFLNLPKMRQNLTFYNKNFLFLRSLLDTRQHCRRHRRRHRHCQQQQQQQQQQ